MATENDVFWNPWHGCHKKSEGCLNCYVYRRDGKYDLDASIVKKNADFTLPVDRKRNGEYKIPPNSTVYTCFTSDFLVEEADEWREDAYLMIAERQDLNFLFITKRIERFSVGFPKDIAKKGGFDNLFVGVTCENQKRADERLKILKDMPIKHKFIAIEPMLEEMDISEYLLCGIEEVTVGGESGNGVRECNYDWILKIREQCISKNVRFTFHQTGARFIKDGKLYIIPRKDQHSQAKKAKIDFVP